MTAVAAFAAAGLALSLVSSRAPYRRAGLQFWPVPGQSYGTLVVGMADLRDGAVEQLLEDPNIDVSIGKADAAFKTIADMGELEQLFEEIGAMLVIEGDGGAAAADQVRNDDKPPADAVDGKPPAEPAPAGADVAKVIADAKTPAGAVIKVGGKPKPARKP